MEAKVTEYPPGDPRLIEKIVGQLKSQGIFDQFRKECIADVDTKPAYQNLHQRVEGVVTGYLAKQEWKPDLNKNHLRETLRKHIYDSGFLDIGVERIVDQVVNPKIHTVFLPHVEELVYSFLGLEKPERPVAKAGPYLMSSAALDAKIAETKRKVVALSDFLPKDINTISNHKGVALTDHLPKDIDQVSTNKVTLINTHKDHEPVSNHKVVSLSDLLPKDLEPVSSPESSGATKKIEETPLDETSRDSDMSGISGLTSHHSPSLPQIPGMDSPNTDSCLSLAAHDVVEDVDDQDGMMEVEIQGETATWEDSSKSSIAMELDINSTDDKIETSEEPSGVGHLSMETEESHALPGVNCAAFVEMERGRKGPDESNIDSNNSGGEDRQTILTSTKYDGEESNVESITSTVGDSYTVSKAKLCLADNTLDKSESILRDLNALEIDESSSSNSTKSPSKLKKVEGSTMIKCEVRTGNSNFNESTKCKIENIGIAPKENIEKSEGSLSKNDGNSLDKDISTQPNSYITQEKYGSSSRGKEMSKDSDKNYKEKYETHSGTDHPSRHRHEKSKHRERKSIEKSDDKERKDKSKHKERERFKSERSVDYNKYLESDLKMEKEIEKKKVSETKRNNDFEIKKDKVPDITKDKDHQHSHVSKKEKEGERKKDKDVDSKKDSKNEKEKYTEKKKKDVDKNNEHDKKEVNKKFDNDSRKEKESKDKSKSKHDDKHKGEDKHHNKDKSKGSKDIKHEKLDKKDDKLVRSSDKQSSKDDEHTKYNVKEEKYVKSNNKEVSFTKLYSKDAKHDKSENSKNEKHSKSNEKGNDKGEKYVKSREKDSNREKHKDTKHKERSAKSIHCSSTKKDVKGKSSGDDHHQHREKHTSSEDRPSTDRDSNGTASQSQGRESSTTSTVGATSDSSHREDSSKEGKGGKENEGQQSDEAEATHLNIQFKTMVLKLEDCASMLKTGSSQIMLSLPPSPSSSLPFKKRPMQDSDELEDTFEAKGAFKTDIVNGVHEKKITKLEEPIKKNNSDSHGIQKNIKVECVDEIKTEPDLETGKTFQAKRKGSSGDKQNETEKECNPLPRNVKRTKLGEIDQLLQEDMTMSIDTPLVTNQLIIRKKEVKSQQIPSLVDSKQLHLKANPNLQVACQLASKTKFSSIKKPDCSTNDTPESKIKSSCPRSDSKGSTYDKTQSDKEDFKQHINLQSFEDYTEDFKYFVPFENNSFITEKNQHFIDCFARLKAAVEEPITLQLTKFLNTSIESEKKLCSKVTETSKRLEVSKVFPATPQRGRRAGLSSSKATNQSNLGSLRLKRGSSKPASGPNKTLKSPNPSGRRLTKAQEAMELQEEFCQSSTPIYQAPAKPNEPSVSICGHESTSNSLAVHSNGSSDEDQGYEKADVNALLIDLYKESFTPQDIKGNNNSLIGGCRRVGLSRRLTSQGDGPEQTRKKDCDTKYIPSGDENNRTLSGDQEPHSTRAQRYNSDDLYKPRPLFSQGSRRNRNRNIESGTHIDEAESFLSKRSLNSDGTLPLIKKRR